MLFRSAEGHFRLDLFYRLSVFQIKLPSLNERVKDIPILANSFLQNFALKSNKKNVEMSPEFTEKLCNHRWKGNIRELKNVMERAVILMDHEELTVENLPLDIQFEISHTINNTFDLASVEKQHIQKILLITKGNKTESSRLLGIGLTTLYRKIEEYGIN